MVDQLTDEFIGADGSPPNSSNWYVVLPTGVQDTSCAIQDNNLRLFIDGAGTEPSSGTVDVHAEFRIPANCGTSASGDKGIILEFNQVSETLADTIKVALLRLGGFGESEAVLYLVHNSSGYAVVFDCPDATGAWGSTEATGYSSTVFCNKLRIVRDGDDLRVSYFDTDAGEWLWRESGGTEHEYIVFTRSGSESSEYTPSLQLEIAQGDIATTDLISYSHGGWLDDQVNELVGIIEYPGIIYAEERYGILEGVIEFGGYIGAENPVVAEIAGVIEYAGYVEAENNVAASVHGAIEYLGTVTAERITGATLIGAIEFLGTMTAGQTANAEMVGVIEYAGHIDAENTLCLAEMMNYGGGWT